MTCCCLPVAKAISEPPVLKVGALYSWPSLSSFQGIDQASSYQSLFWAGARGTTLFVGEQLSIVKGCRCIIKPLFTRNPNLRAIQGKDSHQPGTAKNNTPETRRQKPPARHCFFSKYCHQKNLLRKPLCSLGIPCISVSIIVKIINCDIGLPTIC